MKIKSINASYSSRKVNIQDVEFNKGLTLLVGASGVGKTQILDAICDIKTVALGESINGFSWQIEFSIDEHDYLWSGEFNGVEEDALARVQGLFSKSKSRSNSNARIKTEQLYIDSDLIIHREEEQIIFKGSPTLKLAPNESCIKLLQQENLITPIFESFKKVKLIASQDETPFANIAVGLNNQDFNSFNELRALTSHILEKAYLCQNKFEDKFEDICEAYKEIFPFIKNIEIMQTELNIPNSDGKKLYQYMYRILEDGVEDWIYQEQISSG
ncbi:MAG: AAA family ATPase, partial [Acinetobacter junii]